MAPPKIFLAIITRQVSPVLPLSNLCGDNQLRHGSPRKYSRDSEGAWINEMAQSEEGEGIDKLEESEIAQELTVEEYTSFDR